MITDTETLWLGMAYNYYGKVKTVALVKALSPGVRCAFGNA